MTAAAAVAAFTAGWLVAHYGPFGSAYYRRAYHAAVRLWPPLPEGERVA